MPQLPPLAGLAGYARAAAPGYSVAENVRLFLRYAWIEKRLMDVGLYWLASTPEWEMKEALGLHLSLDAIHVDQIRTRVSEMRNPAPRMDVSPDPAIDRFFAELLAASTTTEKVVGLYGVLRPALLTAYRRHVDEINPVIDHPTRRMLQHILLDEEEQAQWGDAAVAAVTAEDADGAAAWCTHRTVFCEHHAGRGTDRYRTGDVDRTGQLYRVVHDTGRKQRAGCGSRLGGARVAARTHRRDHSRKPG